MLLITPKEILKRFSGEEISVSHLCQFSFKEGKREKT